MRFYVRLLLLGAVFVLIAVTERPQKASTDAVADRAASSLCVGRPRSVSHRSWLFARPDLLTLNLELPALPWGSVFDPLLGSESEADARHHKFAVLGLPIENVAPPPRSALAPAQTVDVSVNNFFYSPQFVHIVAGDTVRWTWNSSPHSVTSGDCCAPSNVFCSPNDLNCSTSPSSGFGFVYSHTFNTPGSFDYYCNVHLSAMSGTVIVDPAAVSTTLQFDAANYNVSEGCAAAVLTVSRTGATTGTNTVDFVSSDGTALQRFDYSIASGTLSFAAGETSKTLRVLTTEDASLEGSENLTVTLSNVTGNAALGPQSSATVTINDNDTVTPPATQPIDDTGTFVCQHYHDFLSREPDTGGFDFWTGQISQCGSDQTCVRNKRLDVSNAFFFELEFQQTGAYTYRLYREAFGNSQPFPNPIPDPAHPGEENKVPLYLPFMKDRARVRGGPQLAQLQLDLANAFVQRPEFTAKYAPSLSGPAFVDAVLATISDIGVDLGTQRQALIDQFNTGGRGAVIYRLADDNAQANPINNRAFIDAEYNRAFVYTQYAGYLRRNADMAGFLFWLDQINHGPLRSGETQHAMVCSFITSGEYQQRFSPLVTHGNGECPQ